jgi:hypothetical protein
VAELTNLLDLALCVNLDADRERSDSLERAEKAEEAVIEAARDYTQEIFNEGDSQIIKFAMLSEKIVALDRTQKSE